MSRNASYYIFSNDPPNPLIISDTGNHKVQLTVTNDIERIVKDLYTSGLLNNSRVFKYYDSDGELNTVLHRDGKFLGWA